MIYYQQQTEYDCAISCLAMIASHYNQNCSFKELAVYAETNQNGTTISGIVKAATKIGLECTVFNTELIMVSKKIPVPFIAQINHEVNGFIINHFIVINKVSKNELEIWDPNPHIKIVKNTKKEILPYWGGYIIIFNKKEGIPKIQNNSNILISFLPLLKTQTGNLVFAGLSSLLIVFFGIVSSLYSRYIIDEVLFANAKNTLNALSIGMIIIVIINSIISVFRSVLLMHFSFKIDLKIVFAFFEKIVNLPYKYFDNHKTGDTISRLEDAQKIRNALSQMTLSLIMDLIMLLIVGPMLFLTNAQLFFILICTVPLSSVIVMLFSGIYQKRYRQLMIESASVQSFLVESINGMSTIKAMNAQNNTINEYERKYIKAVNTSWETDRISILQGLFIDLTVGISSACIFWIGNIFILQNMMSLGTLISFNVLSAYFSGPLNRLVNLQAGLQEAYVAAERLKEIFEMDIEKDSNFKIKLTDSLAGGIRVNKIFFQYSDSIPLYKDLSFEIKGGECVAFVGPSGCGKTTLLKLLLRFYEFNNGEIYFDDHNIKDLDVFNLRSRIGYVPQDVLLFSGSIENNISMHHPEASYEDVVNAAKKAGIHEYISALPDRYNTELNERGGTLSGGEKQRLALARALLCNPKILFFDEATSNLDTISENKIFNTINSLKEKDITIVIIAHKLTNIINCDQIFVMNAGSIVEKGSHEELVRINGLYASLYKGQSV